MLVYDNIASTGIRPPFLSEGSLPPLGYDQETTRICLEEGEEGPMDEG